MVDKDAAFHGMFNCHAIRVLQIAAHGNAQGDSGNLEISVFFCQKLYKKGRCGFPFRGGIGGNNDLSYILGAYPF